MVIPFLPWGFATIVASIVHYDNSIEPLITVISILELALIIFGKYPELIKLNIDKRLGALIFCMLLNIVSNLAVFIWIFKDLSI